MSEYRVPDFGCCQDTHVYGLDESIVYAKYPMSVDTDSIISAEEMSYWLRDDFLPKFIRHMDSGEYPHYEICEDHVDMTIQKEDGSECHVLLDEEDIPYVFPFDWHCDEYCRSNQVGLMHRHLMRGSLADNEDAVVDHINGSQFDNRKQNLRLANKSQNSYNSVVRSNNTSGVMGVSWKHDRNKWKAYIRVRGKLRHLGYFDAFNDAVKARLEAERDICGSFAPQRHLFDEYYIEPVEEAAGPMKTYARLKDAISAYKNLSRLGLTEKGEGHDQALTGIVVEFELDYTIKAWTEEERYTFINFISSQSTMHRMARFDLDEAYTEYTDPRSIEVVRELVAKYNETKDPEDYLRVLYSNPCGMKLRAGLVTNYRQLKTVYAQRKNHRLPEWREFCAWIETLPFAEDLILPKKEEAAA